MLEEIGRKCNQTSKSTTSFCYTIVSFWPLARVIKSSSVERRTSAICNIKGTQYNITTTSK